jgi:hypothetical protein
MGQNGQQLYIYFPTDTTGFQVGGTNQNNNYVYYKDRAGIWAGLPNPQDDFYGQTLDWWWKNP